MTIQEAVKNIKESSKENFDATIEVHINLDIDTSKADQIIRYITVLPNGTGKNKKVAVLASKKVVNADIELNEEDIDKIILGKLKPKVDFDVLIAEPRYMPKLAKAAKVLGPAGMMPNPKTGTVTENVEKAVEDTKKGKIEVKNEKDFPIIHTIIGKVSFSEDALIDNFNALITSLRQSRPQKAKPNWIESIYIASTMGKSFNIDLE